MRFSLALVVLLSILSLACQSDEERVAALLVEGDGLYEAGSLPEAAIEYRRALKVDPNSADAHYGLARSFLGQGKGREAMWEFAETVRLDGDNLDARLSLGTLALIAKNHEETFAQADAVLAQDPTQVNGLILRGQALEGLGRPEEAEAMYLRAVEGAEDKAPYLLVLASYYERQGDRESAEPPYVRQVEIDPTFSSYTALGRFLAQDTERYDETVQAFEHALEAANESEKDMAYQNLAKLHFTRDDMQAAKRVLRAGIEEFGDSPADRVNMMYLLARFHGERGAVEEHDALLEAASEIYPDDPKPHLILSDYRAVRGDLEGALEALDLALKASPGHLNSTLRKAELLVDLGFKSNDPQRVTDGMAIADSMLANEPTNGGALYVKGKGAIALDDFEEAVRLLRLAVDAEPERARFHLALGNALERNGNRSAARAEIARAVELEPRLFEARGQLAKLHAALGEHEYAVEQGEAYLQFQPGDGDMRLLVAQSLAALGRSADALGQVGQLEGGSGEAQVHFARGNLLLASGEPAEARSELRQANALRPHHPLILRTLMRVEERLGNLEAMRADVDAAHRAKPEDAELARIRGVFARRTGDLETAEAMMARAIELDADNISAYRELAQIYQGTGRLSETRDLYQQALERKPDAARLWHELATLDQLEGHLDRAIAGYEKAIALDDRMSQSKNNLAYVLAENGRDLDRALDLAQEAKAAMPDSPGAADTLGWVLYHRGIPSAAVGYLREAVAGMQSGTEASAVVHHHLAMAYEANDQKDLAIESLERSLSELEQSMTANRAAGGSPEEPSWAASARESLGRLKVAG